MSSSRRGFTLIELLVVIAIIAVLISMLLPAVQKVRESGNKTKCSNNLKQLGLALTQYESVYHRFPAAGYYAMPVEKPGLLINILPYIEQKPLYDKYDLGTGPEYQTDAATGIKLNDMVVPLYLCPSDGGLTNNPNGSGRHNYSPSGGPTSLGGPVTNPAASCGINFDAFAQAGATYNVPAARAGVFDRRGSETKVDEIPDGLSNTIFMGEVRPQCSTDHVSRGWGNTTYNSAGLSSTLIPINYDTCDPNNPDSCHKPNNWTSELGFKSRHMRGSLFLFGDGTVRFLREDVDHQNYQYLGSRNDKQAVTFD